MRRTLLWSLLCVSLFGCGRDPRICDGSEDLRFGALILPFLVTVHPGQQVMWDNGYTFLYIQGTCRFWVKPHGDIWESVYEGTLDEASEERLGRDMRYGSWTRMVGEWTPWSVGFETSPYIFYPEPSLARTIICHGGCLGEPLPGDLQEMRTRYPEILNRLFRQGASLEGPVRYTLVRNEPGAYEDVEHLPWPIAGVDPAPIAITRTAALELTYGMGRVTSTPEEASALRGLRQEFRDRQLSRLTPHIPVIDSAGTRYQLFMRDALPIEDERGLVRPR